MSIWESIKQVSKAVIGELGPGEYMAAGRKIRCPHCGGTYFIEGSAQLNTAGMTFLGLDWANRSATTLMCDHCGYIQWYGEKPERV